MTVLKSTFLEARSDPADLREERGEGITPKTNLSPLCKEDSHYRAVVCCSSGSISIPSKTAGCSKQAFKYKNHINLKPQWATLELQRITLCFKGLSRFFVILSGSHDILLFSSVICLRPHPQPGIEISVIVTVSMETYDLFALISSLFPDDPFSHFSTPLPILILSIGSFWHFHSSIKNSPTYVVKWPERCRTLCRGCEPLR